jgi:hypothetical protein
MGKLDHLGDAVRSVIRAYHGSPYDFDRFDASKIGTGEGEQAYGHGLYFAQSPSVAQEYKKQAKLFRPNSDGAWSKRTISDAEDSVAHAGSREEAIRHLNVLLESVAEDLSLRPQVEDAIAYLQNGKPPKPRLYEVEIDHSEEALLNWDRPTAPAGGVGARAAEVLRSVSPRDIDQSSLDFIRSVRPGGYSRPGYGTAIDSVERALQKLVQDPAGADELRSAGIPGVRYLDGVSRSSGSGTRNYVMFPGTEDSIRILRKYAIPGAVGTGVASQYEESP